MLKYERENKSNYLRTPTLMILYQMRTGRGSISLQCLKKRFLRKSFLTVERKWSRERRQADVLHALSSRWCNFEGRGRLNTASLTQLRSILSFFIAGAELQDCWPKKYTMTEAIMEFVKTCLQQTFPINEMQKALRKPWKIVSFADDVVQTT